jgi:hypothetical protein
VPYSLVGKMQGKLVARNFQVVVCGELFILMCLQAIRLTCSLVYTDESHFIKDAKAQRTKAVVPLLKAARRAICLTGTPALSRPVELYSQVEALRPNVFPKFNEFAQRYCSVRFFFFFFSLRVRLTACFVHRDRGSGGRVARTPTSSTRSSPGWSWCAG